MMFKQVLFDDYDSMLLSSLKKSPFVESANIVVKNVIIRANQSGAIE